MRRRESNGHYMASILVFLLTRLTIAIVAAPILVLFLAFILVNVFLDLNADEPLASLPHSPDGGMAACHGPRQDRFHDTAAQPTALAVPLP